MRTRAGLSSEAVYIFNNMVRKLLEEHHPEYVASVFESSAPTFRDEIYQEYKANRAAAPPELMAQIPYIRRLLEALRVYWRAARPQDNARAPRAMYQSSRWRRRFAGRCACAPQVCVSALREERFCCALHA